MRRRAKILVMSLLIASLLVFIAFHLLFFDANLHSGNVTGSLVFVGKPRGYAAGRGVWQLDLESMASNRLADVDPNDALGPSSVYLLEKHKAIALIERARGQNIRPTWQLAVVNAKARTYALPDDKNGYGYRFIAYYDMTTETAYIVSQRSLLHINLVSGDMRSLDMPDVHWGVPGSRGQLIAGTSANNETLVVSTHDGTVEKALRLPGARAPVLSPSGQLLAFVKDQGWRSSIVVVDISTSALCPLLDTYVRQLGYARRMAWSSDSRYLFIEAPDLVMNIGPERHRSLVYVLDTHTGRKWKLPISVDVACWSPAR